MALGVGALGAALLLLAPERASAGAFIRMQDGRVLEGKSVSRDGDLYLLELEDGGVVTLPVSLVVEVGLKQEAPPPPPDEPPQMLPPATRPWGEAGVIAGTYIPPPTTQEQLAVFGKPAEFQQSPVVSTLNPTYWEMDPEEANWNPSKWAQAPTDPNWHPTSAYDMNKDVLADSRSTWATSPTNPNWQPTDGFKNH